MKAMLLGTLIATANAAYAAPTAHSPATAWVQSGLVTVDHYQRLFAQADGGGFSRIDPDTGLVVWTSPGYGYSEKDCYFKDAILRYTAGRVTSFNPADGAVKWSQKVFDGPLSQIRNASFQCNEAAKSAYVFLDTVDDGGNLIVGLDPSSGAVLLTAKDSFDGIVATLDSGVLASLAETPTEPQRLQFLTRDNGRVVWIQDVEQRHVTVHGGCIYLQQNGRFGLLDATSGELTYSVAIDGEASVAFAADSIYLVDASSLSNISARTGQRNWKKPWRGGVDTELVVLPNDDLAVYTRHFDAPSGPQTSVYSRDGSQRWTQTVGGDFRLSSSGSLYVMSQEEVLQLDPSSGHVNWTFKFRDPVDPRTDAFPGGLIGSQMLDSDATVFVPFSGGGYHEHSGGVLALDEHTGALVWRYDATERLSLIGQTDRALLISEGLFSPSTIKALLKNEKPAHIDD